MGSREWEAGKRNANSNATLSGRHPEIASPAIQLNTFPKKADATMKRQPSYTDCSVSARSQWTLCFSPLIESSWLVPFWMNARLR